MYGTRIFIWIPDYFPLSHLPQASVQTGCNRECPICLEDISHRGGEAVFECGTCEASESSVRLNS